MRFWDASALVPLCTAEPSTATVQGLLREDLTMCVWWGSPVECWSALSRRRREGLIDQEAEDQARQRLAEIQRKWFEIGATNRVRDLAGSLLLRHALRAADALQLAAAIVTYGTQPAGEFITFDERLADAARSEGLKPIP